MDPLFLAATAATPALVQPQPEEESLPVEAVVGALRGAYQAGPLAQEVLVRARDREGRGRTERFRVFVDAPGERARLELGPLSVWAASGRLVAVHSARADVCLVVEADGQGPADLLAGNLPPVPAPPLALAFGGSDFSAPTPYSRGVVWLSATPAKGLLGEQVEAVVLRGQWGGGETEALVDAKTELLRSMTVWVGGAAVPALTLEMRFTPAEAGDPAAWEVRPEGRRVVSAIRDLEPPSGPVRAGQQAPPLALLGTDLAPWSLAAELRALPPGGWLALVLYRDRDNGAAERTATLAAEAVGLSDAALRAGPQPEGVPTGLALRVVGVFEPGDAGAARMRAAAQRWRESSPDRPPLLWTSSAARSIDLFDPSAAGLVLIVDGAGVVRFIHAPDPETAAPALSQVIGAALAGAGGR